MTHIMFHIIFSFLLARTSRQRRPFGNRCLEHFPGEYDQFGMIKLRFTAPGSAGYVHIPQGVTVFHKSLVPLPPPPPLVYVYSRHCTRYTRPLLIVAADAFTLASPPLPSPLQATTCVSNPLAVRNLPPPNHYHPPPTSTHARILCIYKHRPSRPLLR